MFYQVMNKTTKAVKYECRGNEAEAPAWTIERPGSYAEGWEHLRYQTTRVRSVGFTLFSESADYGWTIKGIIIEVEPSDGEPGTIVTTVDPDSLPQQPMWLGLLAARAISE